MPIAHVRPRTLRELQAYHVLRMLPTETVSDVAADLMVQGYESESIVFMAGLGRHPNPLETDELIERAIGEANLEPLAEKEATTVVAQRIASAILDGAISPYEGARSIWERLRRFDHPDLLIEFMFLAHEIDELRPLELEERRSCLEEEIRQVSAELLVLRPNADQPPEST